VTDVVWVVDLVEVKVVVPVLVNVLDTVTVRLDEADVVGDDVTVELRLEVAVDVTEVVWEVNEHLEK